MAPRCCLIRSLLLLAPYRLLGDLIAEKNYKGAMAVLDGLPDTPQHHRFLLEYIKQHSEEIDAL